MDYVIKTKRIKNGIASDGAADRIAYSVEIPSIEGLDTVNGFYAEVGKRCIGFCERRLPATCDPTHRYSYRLSCRASVENDRLTVVLRATLNDRTTRSAVSSHRETHEWELDTLRLRTG